ncbi:hypothetical protein [Streptomyces sp. NPDC050428]|uniref:hypothetical protein n=1 Tax=Streptomyces sp. NPDC050428 TaxID=3155757 RepID=UPI0034164F7D
MTTAPTPGVLFDFDPTRTPLIVRRRPTNIYFRPLPPGAYESDGRIVLARDVRAGDLILASFTTFPTPGRMTRGTSWVTRPYAADPRPWNPACRCTPCSLDREVCAPGPRVVLSAPTDSRWGTECDVWEADELALIIPAAMLLLPIPA